MICKKLFLALFIAVLLLSGCIAGSPKNDLKDKVVSSEQVSFADYQKGLANEKFSAPTQNEASPDYISVPQAPQYPSDESYPSFEATTSYDVLEPGSATQEQIIEITQSEESSQNLVVPSDGETPSQGTGGESTDTPTVTPGESMSASDVAVILPYEEDYYANYEVPEEPNGGETPPVQEVNTAFVAKLEQIGQILSDVSSISAETPKKIWVAEKDAAVKEITGEPQGPVVPLAFFPLKETQNPVEMYDAVSIGCLGVHTVDETFFSEPNRVNVYSFYPKENVSIVFGLLVDPKSSQPLTPSETPFENPQINMYAGAETISTIFE
ncbi:MAG: hypothetical protein Q7K34_04165, partial [archaeon]|nr:hypothetical protein [archaeon]